MSSTDTKEKQQPSTLNLLKNEIIKYSTLGIFFLSAAYIAWIASTQIPSWIKLILIILNPMTIRTAIILYMKRETLMMAYDMFENFYIAKGWKKIKDEEKK